MFIVTGASSGIGRSTAVALADEGLDVVAVARNGEALGDLRRGRGDRIEAVVADLAASEGVDALEHALRIDRCLGD